MRAYYIHTGLEGCYHVRCFLPMAANGWDGDKTSFISDHLSNQMKAQGAQYADVVVFHRPDEPQKLELARMLKKIGKKIVFDNDDTYKDHGGLKLNEFLDKQRMVKGLEKINHIVDAFIKEADLVTCSTEFLKDEYLKLNPNVEVLPNCIDPFYFDEPLKNDTDVVRIGIVGSIAVTKDFWVIKPILDHFKDRKDVKFVLFSLPPDKEDKFMRELYAEEYAYLESYDFEWQPFVPMHQYYDTLNELRLDIAVIPRHDNYFNRCKSNLKFLEMSMFEIPVIAQSFSTGDSPYEANPEDAKHMILAQTDQEWIDAIEDLVADKEKRAKIGKTAKEYVLANYNIEDKAHLWEDAYKKLWK